MQTLGWIGLGHMGMPMCKNLIKAGYHMVVRDTSKEIAQEALDLGAEWADTAKEVAQKAECIFTMLPNGTVLKSVVTGTDGIAEGLTPGKIVVDMSTVSAMDSSVANDAIEEKGCKLLRSPVTGSVGLAASGTLGLLISGDRDVLEKVEPALDQLGNHKHWLGENEEARVMKIALNTMVGNTTQLLAEAVTLAEKAGIPVEKSMEVIAGSAVGSSVVQSKVDPINTGNYEPAFSVRMMMKDFDLAMDTAKQYQSSLPVTALVRQFYEEAAAAGRGNDDYSVLVKRLEQNVGIDR